MTMIISTAIFGHFTKIPSDDLPYPNFAYTALLPWIYFASALNRALLGKQGPDFGVMAVGAVVVAVLLVGGLVFFKHMERTFAAVV